MPLERTIDDVLGRMYNWKMRSAYAYAMEVPDFPSEALSILKEMGEEYGNCGWNEGTIFDALRQKNHKVAAILGYRWDEGNDRWVKHGTQTLQEVFDMMVDHLAQQKRRSYDTEHKACSYRTKEGLSCVVGCLLSDHVFERSIKGRHEYASINLLMSIPGISDELAISGVDDPLEFYLNMQSVHDNSISLVDIKSGLKSVALKFNLDPNGVEKVTVWMQ